MKNKNFYCNILFVAICILMASCSSKSDINRNDEPESQVLYRIQAGGKYGFINEQGKIVIEPQFDWANWFIFNDGVCHAVLGERNGLINSIGEFVVELNSSIKSVSPFLNNDVSIFDDVNWKEGLISKSGDIVLPSIYKNIKRDGNKGFIVEDTLGKFGYVKCDGEFIVPCQYDDVKGFEEGLMVVAKNSKFGYVDTTGVLVIDMVYSEAYNFGDGLARVMDGEKWQFIDYDGNVATKFNYDEILSGFECNRAFVRYCNEIDLIDKEGTIISTIDADSVYGFHEGYASVQKNGKYGKLDSNGTIIIQPKYEKLFRTNNGLSIFEKNNNQGVIDTAGNIIVDATHEKVIANKDISLIWCVDDDFARSTYYDRKGNLIWKDMSAGFTMPDKPTKEDWKSYFDAKLADMDPIEGLYYVEWIKTYQNRTNPSMVGTNGGDAQFWAVARDLKTNSFVAYVIEDKPNTVWKKKFVRIGDSNKYAIMDYDTTMSKYADNSSFIMEDPYKFEFQLEENHNSNYNFYDHYTFTRDYPSESIFEQVQQPEWTGTGFAIADGYLVTNYHVTNGAKTIKVRGINGDMKEIQKGYVVASDRDRDLAIIKIVDKRFEGFEDIPYCIGKSLPEVGDEVFVLGYPMTSTMGQEIKLTDGIISAASGYKGDQSMYQISAAVQPGNSGGPLFDKEGNVIGVICAKHADAENANYAIKVSYLYSLVNSSGLGIKMADNNKVKSKSLPQKVKQVKPFVYLIECRSH